MAESLLSDVPQVDAVGERFDLGLLPQQQTPQTTLVQLKRRKLELLQALSDKLTGGVVPRTPQNSTTIGAFARGGLEGLLTVPGAAAQFALNSALQGPAAAIAMPQDRSFIPKGQELMASANQLGQSAAALTNWDASQFQNPFEAEALKSEAVGQEHPVAFPVGRAVGEIAGLRSPVARARSLAEMNAIELGTKYRALAQVANEAGTLKGFRYAETIPDAFRAAVAESKGFSSLMNRAQRAAETGLEGAAISILEGGDPLETAAYAAGGQAAGSVLLGGLTGLFSGGPLKAGAKIALSAASVGAILQTVKSLAPGGQDYSLESIESGFNKVGLGIAAGVLSGLAGAGRFPIKAVPAISDYLTAMPRAASMAVLHDALNDTRTETVIQKLSTDPDYFGPAAARRLERAFRNPNISISGVIDDLMEARDFRNKFNALETKE